MTAKPEKQDIEDEVILEVSEKKNSASGDSCCPTGDVALDGLLSRVEDVLSRLEDRVGTNAPVSDREDVQDFHDKLVELPQQIEVLGQSILRELDHRLESLETMMTEVGQEMKTHLAEHNEIGEPAAPQAETVDEQGDQQWERCLLGDELCQNPELADVRRKLLDDVLSGVAEARALVGQVMLVQSVSAEQMPELMRSVGEAYYRWQPRTILGDEPLELVLASWLTERAQMLGLGNKIELVRTGTRFDASRHLASERGVEITAVHGWVVVRNTGKVYTRASVSVK